LALVLGTVLVSCLQYLLRYAAVHYITEATVKILDERKKNPKFTLDMSSMFGKSSINLENEIALFKSVQHREQL
jgi:hypothetical protein